MISWMQNNNKYLVITIWVATIAFIGAGFVGWGSVSFGSKSSSIAKVGDISITKAKYSFSYNNLYAQYAAKDNKFDKKAAEQLGLGKQVYRNLVSQSLLLNMAKEYGIIATEEEVGLEIVAYPAFKDKDGKFDKKIYDNFLRSRGLRAKEFESILKDDLIIKKLSSKINIKPLDYEKEVMKSTFNIADKIKYKVLKQNDINITVNDADVKSFWEKNKLNYLTATKYKLDLLWTDTKEINVTDADLDSYYKQYSFNYLDDSGKVKELKDVKDAVAKDIKLEKIKKTAAIERSRFKKGKLKATESLTLNSDDTKFNKELWNAIKAAKDGDYLKPKAAGDKLVTVHIVKTVKPQEMTFDEAKELARKDYKDSKAKEELAKLTTEALKDSSKFNLEPKDYINLSKFEVLPELTPQDSLKVIRTVFASSKKVDKVDISDGVVVYEVLEQKLLDNNSTNSSLDKEVASIKNSELMNNLILKLSKKYSVESYAKEFK